jgi:hypothetical protein
MQNAITSSLLLAQMEEWIFFVYYICQIELELNYYFLFQKQVKLVKGYFINYIGKKESMVNINKMNVCCFEIVLFF